jgi:ABC-2 type transport system ATP-binding protein
MGAETAISCRGLVKRYEDGVLAVDGLDLEVARGECFGLLGPNGAGKTTTVEILEGLRAPTAGTVRVLGTSYAEDEAGLRARIGITLQETHLDDRLTVGEIVALFRSFYATGRAVDEVLGLVSLTEKRGSWYERLSGGQKQRLAVALAVVGDPELIFLDEPTTGLDPQSRRQLWDVVSTLKHQGRTVLITTHNMEEAERLCDRVAIVDQGRVIARGSPRELIAEHIGGEIVEFSAAPADLPADGIGGLPGVRALRASGQGFALTVDAVHVAVPALLGYLAARGASLGALSTHSATLEDVFLALTGRKLRD